MGERWIVAAGREARRVRKSKKLRSSCSGMEEGTDGWRVSEKATRLKGRVVSLWEKGRSRRRERERGKRGKEVRKRRKYRETEKCVCARAHGKEKKKREI